MKEMEFAHRLFVQVYMTPLWLFGRNKRRWVRVVAFCASCVWCSHIYFTCVIFFPIYLYCLISWVTEI